MSPYPERHQPLTPDTTRHRTDRPWNLLAAVAAHGIPASTLTDNGMVFTTRLAGGKGGRNALEAELRRLHVAQKHSAPTTHDLRQGGAVPADDEKRLL